MTLVKLTRKQWKIIFTINFGSILEWYEIYTFVYLVPILSKVFFNFKSDISNLTVAFAVFGIGFLVRTLGAVSFGWYGDLKGRKPAFLSSIILLTLPTCAIGFLGSYGSWGIFAPICLVIFRILQSIPAAGEIPGALCFLYENSDVGNQKLMTSCTAIGNQIGGMIALCEMFLMDLFISEDFLMSWGWRIPFWIGGAIGLVGVFLRRRLRETSTFKELEHPDVDKEAYLHAVKNQKSRIALGVAFGAINASTYYLIATYIPTHFSNVIGLNIYWNTFVSFGILLLSTALLPVFGILAEKFNNKKMLIYSAFSIIILLTPIYFSILKNNLFMMLILAILYIIPLSCLSSLLAYRIAHLFSARVRYTGTSLAFNLADGLAGGFTPAIALLLFQITSNPASFCWYILVCSLISLISYFKIKE